MMRVKKNIQAITMVYVLFLVMISLTLAIVVFNSSDIIENNIDIGSNNEEVYGAIYDKGNIAIESVKKYNSNGGEDSDNINCPQDITMTYEGVPVDEYGYFMYVPVGGGASFSVIEKNAQGDPYFDYDTDGEPFPTHANGTPIFNTDGNPQDNTAVERTDIEIAPEGINESTGLVSEMKNRNGTIYCGTNFRGDEVMIFFDTVIQDFTTAYYRGALLQLAGPSEVDLGFQGTNMLEFASVTATPEKTGYPISRINDGIFASGGASSTYDYVSDGAYFDKPFIEFELSQNRNIGLIRIYNTDSSNPNKDNLWYSDLFLLDENREEIDNVYLGYTGYDQVVDIDFKHLNDRNINVKYIRLESRYYSYTTRHFYLQEIQAFEFQTADYEWNIVDFGDSDTTSLSFGKNGIGDPDGLDDDMNSDDRVPSSGENLYPGEYRDDDANARLEIIGNLDATKGYYNIFWNNYLTREIIEENSNNDFEGHFRITDTGSTEQNFGVLHLDLFGVEPSIDYDMKIVQFDRDAYENQFTLLPIATFEGKNFTQTSGYIHKEASGTLVLRPEIDIATVMRFDFSQDDYAIFLKNNRQAFMSYKLTGFRPSPGKLPYYDAVKLWYDAWDQRSVQMDENNNVSIWKDKSVNKYDAIQGDVPEQPDYIGAGSSAALSFNGSSDYLAIEELSYSPTTSRIPGIFVCSVFSMPTSTGGNWAFLDFDRSEFFNFYYDVHKRLGFSIANNTIYDNVQTGLDLHSDSSQHLACASYYPNDPEGSNTKLFLDGELIQSWSRANNSLGNNANRFGFIGTGSEAPTFDGQRNGNKYEGHISEIVYYDTPVSDYYREKIQCYLLEKWGIAYDTGANTVSCDTDIFLSPLYINPINDEVGQPIEVLANHILTGGEKNYVGENLKIIGEN